MKQKCLLPNDEFYELPNTKLLEIFEKGLLLERGRALFVLARRSGENKDITHIVVKQIYDSNNRNTRTIGIASISFLGIAGLLEADTNDTKETVKNILELWAEPDRSNLILFLQSTYQSAFISSII
ncbi:hypothetical protein H6G76_14860 [Nostoc sp. FACHB-152]|uniref:hypothetical protein n=1 Tax=unclassified Nostoc TaxID=2593658 RepID=UPI0016831EC5|nr:MULTISPECIES: hypothetical protein [unclassified Nostoc]MBD2448416.1 hypothetical protein [Nostoc sp. FACHB-152]MBD2470856.1 hypothetical protein [Nostoc sp. FACHB-145]